ncbi:MAG TPA: 50S ribosomal protein L9 [Candidatus Cloacimonetes bacterium]|nr:50S ribosomal protein L9 [Candidatus Cloacimonadota bacterium]HHE40291.1 50S ribosomal protein L9 [Candidatus Cloacimonadota bacterium]
MKIILKKNVENLGTVGEVVKVADGYARNFLFPKGFAIQASDKNKKFIEKFKEEEEKRLAEELKMSEMIIKQIEKTSLLFTRLADENGHLYGSVNEHDIVDELKEKELIIDKHNVKMEQHIKELGDHEVTIELKGDIKGTLKIKVEKEEKE